jgi:competence protein CoiA
VRADLLVRSINTKRVYAIEVQISQLTMAQIIERTRRYAKLGVYVLWLFEWTRDLLSERYSPSLKERWAHALNYGWVYYWREDDEVIPIKFDKYLIHRSEATWFEEGEEQNAGGYDYVSKRYRTPRRGKSLRISSDFQGVTRQAWTGGDIVIPACRILTARSL